MSDVEVHTYAEDLRALRDIATANQDTAASRCVYSSKLPWGHHK